METLLMEYKVGNTKGVKNDELAKKSCVNETSQWFVDAVKDLRDVKGFIAKGADGYVLTEAGAEAMGYKKQVLSHLPTDKAVRVFDILLEEGTISPEALAARIGVNYRLHSFSSALEELVASGYLEVAVASDSTSDGN